MIALSATTIEIHSGQVEAVELVRVRGVSVAQAARPGRALAPARLRRGLGWACNETALAHFVFALTSGSTAAWIGFGAALHLF